MFFRRETPKNPTFTERLDSLRSGGFTVSKSGGSVRVTRGNCAADVSEQHGGISVRCGLLIAGELAVLVDEGYQKFFETSARKRKPALAEDLKDLHGFQEDLKEGLGRESYYNEALGTVSTFYLYDRVKDRDRGVPKRVWE